MTNSLVKTNNTISEIAAALNASGSVLIVSHTSPDPDAYGSAAGLGLTLRQAGKRVVFLNESGASDRLSFIPAVNETVSALPSQKFDLICIVDCGELKRVGDSLLEPLRGLHPTLNIDHHISNDRFGDSNYVISDASSTSELVFDLLCAADLAIPADAATALYAGISGDTGSFRYSNTTQKVFETAAGLVERGANAGVIAQNLYSKNSRASVRVQAEALSAMEFLFGDRCAWIVVPAELAAKHGATKEDTEGLVERGRDIEGVIISVFIREEEGIWKVSMRSRDARFNVSNVAAQFGGGGHIMAAAFRWRRGYDELEKSLRQSIAELFQATAA